MIEAFIRQRGVTRLPGAGTRELAELNREREKAYAEFTKANAWQRRKWRRNLKTATGAKP